MYVGVDTLNMKINLLVIPVVRTVVSFANGVTGFFCLPFLIVLKSEMLVFEEKRKTWTTQTESLEVSVRTNRKLIYLWCLQRESGLHSRDTDGTRDEVLFSPLLYPFSH